MIRTLLDILIPRFVVEDVALDGDDHVGYTIVCRMADIEPHEKFSGIVAMQCFNLFGWALFAKQVGEIRPWVNPHNA